MGADPAKGEGEGGAGGRLTLSGWGIKKSISKGEENEWPSYAGRGRRK